MLNILWIPIGAIDVLHRFNILILMLTMMPPYLSANEYIKKPFDYNVARSDLIVLGKAISGRHHIASDNLGRWFVTIAPTTILKGTLRGHLEMLVSSDDVESDPACCEYGKNYLLLLVRAKDGMYVPVNGRFSVYRLN